MSWNRNNLSLGKRVAAGAMTGFLGVSMSLPFGVTSAIAEEAKKGNDNTEPEKKEQEGESQTAKTEAVYSKANASGQSTGVYVVNSFNTNDAEDVEDPGSYTTVENLSTSQQLTNQDGKTDVTTSAGEPFYYQGDLDAGTQTPWNINITYTLDGQKVSPDDLAGKSGDLDIDLKITGLDDDSHTADFAKSFVLQAQGTFANDNFDLDDGDGATVTQVGNNTLVTYLVLPGQNGDYHIKGKAKNFTYSGWQVSAMPLDMAINVKDFDTSELTDQAKKLEDGATQLDDGATTLSGGLDALNDGAQAASEGAGALRNATGALADGMGQLKGGTSQAVSGSRQLAGGLGTLKKGTGQLAGGAAELKAKLRNDQAEQQFEELADGATQLDNTVKDLSGKLSQINDAKNTIKGMQSQVSQMQGSLNSLKNDQTFSQLSTSTQQHAEAVGNDLASLGNSLTGVNKTLEQLKNNISGQISTAQKQASEASEKASDAQTEANSAASSFDGVNGSVDTANTQLDAAIEAINNSEALKDSTDKQNLINSINAAKNSISTIKNSTDSAKAAATAVSNAANDVATAATSANSAANTLSAVGTKVSTAIDGVKASSGDESQKITSDATTLGDDLKSLQTAKDKMTGSASDLIKKSNDMMSNSDELLTSANNLLSENTNQIGDLARFAQGVNKLATSLTNDGELAKAIDALASGASRVDSGTASAKSGANALASGARTLDTATGTAANGAKQLNSGAGQLADGIDTLADGTDTAYAGSLQLKSGLDELASSVQGIDQKVLDKVQDTIDQKLGRGYQLHSFVDPDNTNVKEVEFIYVVDGVKEPSDDSNKDNSNSDDQDQAQDQSFIDRLVALFQNN